MTSSKIVLVAATGEGDAESANSGGVVDLLRACREHPRLGGWWLKIVEAAQLRLEHALELTDADFVLFLTEAPRAAKTLEFRSVPHRDDHRIDAEGDVASPEDVLHTLSTLGHRTELPRCYALTLGNREPSPPASEGSDTTAEFLFSLLIQPDRRRWDELARVGDAYASSPASSSSRTRAPAAS